MTKSLVPIENDENAANTDFSIVRQNLQELINIGNLALAEVVQLADQSQSPRMYEVLSQLLKTQIDANRELLEAHKKRQSLQNNAPIQKTVNNNKNLIIASTADVLKLIQSNSKKDQPLEVEVQKIEEKNGSS